jgi:hypothetical protein
MTDEPSPHVIDHGKGWVTLSGDFICAMVAIGDAQAIWDAAKKAPESKPKGGKREK